MTFEEWADRTFGKEFKDEDSIAYCRMSAAWDAGYVSGQNVASQAISNLRKYQI